MSKIEWTDKTWNPITGCKVGCNYCYAANIASRFWGDRAFTDVQFHPERLGQPRAWKKPAMVFVNSMSDMFGDGVEDEWLDKVFAVMALTPQHTYQILTKRPERMMSYCDGLTARSGRIRLAAAIAHLGAELNCQTDRYYELIESLRDDGGSCLPLPNVWLGVSVENQKAASDRIPALLETPSALRFLSMEPLLGAVDLQLWNRQTLKGLRLDGLPNQGKVVLPGIDWVIVGGMSGPGSKPCDLAWIRRIISQCSDSDVPVFVKQLGSNPVDSDFPERDFPRNKKWSDISQFPTDLQYRQFPEIKNEAVANQSRSKK